MIFQGGVILREGCDRSYLPSRSKFLKNFNNTLSPVIRKTTTAMDMCNFSENDILIFRFKEAFPLNLFGPKNEYLYHISLFRDN